MMFEKLFQEEFLVRTHTWKFFQWILGIMEMLFALYLDIFWWLDQKLCDIENQSFSQKIIALSLIDFDS